MPRDPHLARRLLGRALPGFRGGAIPPGETFRVRLHTGPPDDGEEDAMAAAGDGYAELPGDWQEAAGQLAAMLTAMSAGDPEETARTFTRRRYRNERGRRARSVAAHNVYCSRPLPADATECDFCGWPGPAARAAPLAHLAGLDPCPLWLAGSRGHITTTDPAAVTCPVCRAMNEDPLPPCHDWHELRSAPAGPRCTRCGWLVTALVQMRDGVYMVGDGRLPAAHCAIHRTEDGSREFRGWLGQQPPIHEAPGLDECRAAGHQFPEDGAGPCARCGLAITGGTDGERLFLAGFLNTTPSRPLLAGPPEDATDIIAELIAGADVIDTGDGGLTLALLGGAALEAIARLAASGAIRDPTQPCPNCGAPAGQSCYPPGSRERAAGRGGGTSAGPAFAAGGLVATPEIDAERLDTLDAVLQDEAEAQAAFDAASRRLPPLSDLPGHFRLTVAANPGRDPEAWRLAGLGAWIAREGEPTADLTAESLTAAELTERLTARRGKGSKRG